MWFTPLVVVGRFMAVWRCTSCQAEEESGVYKAIQRDPLRLDAPVWSTITASARELICGLLEKDPSKRLDDFAAHPSGGSGVQPCATLLFSCRQCSGVFVMWDLAA